MFKDYEDLSELAYDELVQRAKHFMQKSSDEYHKANNELGAYYLIVAERFFNEMKIRIVVTAI